MSNIENLTYWVIRDSEGNYAGFSSQMCSHRRVDSFKDACLYAAEEVAEHVCKELNIIWPVNWRLQKVRIELTG